MLLEAGLRVILDLPTGPTGRYVTDLSLEVAEQARQNVRSTFRTRTGNLEGSIGLFPQEHHDGLSYEIGTEGAPYGKVLEEGSEPHAIIARRAGVLESALDNPDPLAGYRERRDPTRVNHPGAGPKPWLRPALENVFNGG